MGGLSIAGVQILYLVLAAWLAVFAGTWCSSLRALIGAQPEVLPSLMVYAGLTRDVWTVTALSLFAGLAFDSMSLNPAGVSVLPLFLAGWCVSMNRDLILRQETYAQFMLGAAAGALCPLASLLLITVFLRERIEPPILGWRHVWQWGVVSTCAGMAVPLFSWGGEAVRRAFAYEPVVDNRYRGDREMKRWKF